MKIKLAVSDEKFEEVRRFLTDRGIELDDESDFILTQKDTYVGHLTVRRAETNEKLHIAVADIVYIESFGHSVEVHTADAVFFTADRLYQLAAMLDPARFLRISNSVIIARQQVRQITPALSMKFVLLMRDGTRLTVTRGYYNGFRDAFHI